jgi:protein-tyrosine phosphatase
VLRQPGAAGLPEVRGLGMEMTETRVIMACAERQVHWYLGAEPARCTDPRHQHRQAEVHRHRSVVSLPDGTKITAVSFDAVAPYARDRQPDYGLYLDRRWQPPWPHDHLDWPDFGVPGDPASVLSALRTVIDRARTGEQVEVGCLGGHGRTGTALACLAILTGYPATDAVAWVRASYCPEAIETASQEAFITRLRRYNLLNATHP